MKAATVLTLLGLSLDVIGAFIIAVPDISHFRERHRPGRMLEGLRHLELGPLLADSTGYNEIRRKLDEMSDKTLEGDIEALFVATPSITVGDDTDSGLHRKIAVQRAGDEETTEWEDLDFEYVRRILLSDIRRGEAYIRAIGFILLAVGFLLQMAGVVL